MASTAISVEATTRRAPRSPARARWSFSDSISRRTDRRPRSPERIGASIVTLQLKDPALLRQQSYIDGKWVDADNRTTLDVVNPATREKIGTVPKMGAAETRRAIEAASRALPEWAKKTAKERAVILRRWYDLMLTHQEDLAA